MTQRATPGNGPASSPPAPLSPPPPPSPPSVPLADRRSRQTRDEVFAAAIPLFVAQGYDATSMQAVAEAAGVSRRTLYRHFASKDDIVFEAPRRWLEVFEAVVTDRGDAEPTRDLFRRALVAVADFVQLHAESVLAAFSVVMSSQDLLARRGRSDMEWVQRYVELLLPDLVGDPDAPLRAMTAAMAVVAAQNALMIVWAGEEPRRDCGTLMRAVLDQVDSVWPPGSREPPRQPGAR